MVCATTARLRSEEIATIATLLREGISITAIGRQIGRSRDTIRKWAQQSGIDLEPATRAWLPSDEDALVAGLKAGLTAAKIAKTLDRTLSSVRSRINFLGGADFLAQRQVAPAPEPLPPPPVPSFLPAHPDPWDNWSAAMRRLSERASGLALDHP